MPPVKNVDEAPQLLRYLRSDVGPRPETVAKIALIEALRAEGRTFREIGEILGISRQRVHALVSRDEYGRTYGAENQYAYRRKKARG